MVKAVEHDRRLQYPKMNGNSIVRPRFSVKSLCSTSDLANCLPCPLQAAAHIDEEVSILKMAMGHEDAALEDYVEARDACIDDMVYFPNRNGYGLSSVASTSDRLAALQYEFENVKRNMEGETRKAVRLEQKLRVLTQGYQVRCRDG